MTPNLINLNSLLAGPKGCIAKKAATCDAVSLAKYYADWIKKHTKKN